MKLASLKSGRDGQLVVVSKDLSSVVKVPDIAHTLQQAIESWVEVVPSLQDVYEQLNDGDHTQAFPLKMDSLASPLPRAYQWLDGSAYVNHIELVRKARGATLPENFWTDPLMYQGASDNFLGPCEPVLAVSEDWGIDFEAEVSVITDDVPLGITSEEAKQHIKLFMLVNDVSLRNLIPDELAKGFGFLHGKPASSFSPVAVTPDELGEAWDGHKVHLPLVVHLNDELYGQPNAGVDMIFDFPQLVAHAAKSRFLGAGTIVGSGTISNTDRTKGSCCLIEKRMLETIAEGKPSTSFLHFGDRVRIEMFDSSNQSIFGAIDQEVKKYEVVKQLPG